MYDLAVIGTGSAGLVAATSGKRLGLNTIMIERKAREIKGFNLNMYDSL